VKNEEVLLVIKEERNNPHTVNNEDGWLDWSDLAKELPSKTRYWRKVGRIGVTGREKEEESSYWKTLREKRRYWQLKERTVWRTRYWRGFGLIREATWWWWWLQTLKKMASVRPVHVCALRGGPQNNLHPIRYIWLTLICN
jgi:hypothetical protein